ncbi:hypothetical protein niasHS_001848 [Heterodera schachtii]|uniref:Uncharacterized protein n=1 Tax=Heterodera schachtii TaxID=97005 RepID=A0ABD2KAF9_HETSC
MWCRKPNTSTQIPLRLNECTRKRRCDDHLQIIGRPEQERNLLRLKTAIGMELVQLEIIFEAMPANFDEIHFNQRHWACLSFDAIIAGGQEISA